MVEIVAGAGLGLERTSGWLLGSQGEVGDPNFGRYGENVYVNAATGNLVIERKDEVLFGVGNGLDSEFDSVYNSMAPRTDENGDKWQLSTARHVSLLSGTINTAGSTVQRVDADGSDTLYTWSSSSNCYVGTQLGDANDTITYNANSGNWTWTDGATQVSETYKDSLNGYIAKRTDTLGNHLTYTYQTNANNHLVLSTTGDPLLTRVTTADGEYTDLGYDPANPSNLVSLTTHLADGTTVQRVTYGYDSSNRLSTVSIDLTETNQSDQNNQNKIDILTYGYANNSSNKVTSITGDDGSSIQFGYTGNQVTQITEASSTGPARVTNLAYGSTANGLTTTTITDPMGQVTKMTYNASGQLTELDQSPPQQSTGPTLSWKFTYASATDNHVTQVEDPLGNSTYYGYDANGNRNLITDDLGNKITRTYDVGRNNKGTNELLTEVRWSNPGAAGTGNGASGPEVTRYAYNTSDQLRYIVSPVGEVTEYDYDSFGNRSAMIVFRDQDPYDTSSLSLGQVPAVADMENWVSGLADKSTAERTDWTYDFRGNLANATTYVACDSAGAGLANSANTVITYLYDQAGQLLSRSTSGIGNTETFIYDGLFRMIWATDRNGLATHYVYNDEQRTLTVVHTGTGLVDTSLYDLSGELISYTHSGSQAPTPETTTYSYDADGRLRMVTDALGNASGGSPQTFSSYFLYDNYGRKVADVQPDGAITEFGYDAAGNLIYTHDYATRLSSGTNSAMSWLFSKSGVVQLSDC